MIVEKQQGQIIIKLSDSVDLSEIKNTLDFLRFKEITSKSEAREEEFEELLNNIKVYFCL
jgi:chaperonin cofactor prefoldin